MSRLKLVLLLAIPVLAGLGVGLWLDRTMQPLSPAQTETAVGGDFTLQSADGPVSLQDYRGKVGMIYFGYTSCPDICPTSLTMMSSAMKQLTPQEAAQVYGIFISVDPERDTPANMKEYAAYFHPNFVGVTGTPEQIAEIAGKYGAYYKKAEIEGSMGYAVDHSSTIYVVDKQGKVVDQIIHGASPESIASAIRKIL
jgi:protein SCO1/2